MIRRLRIVSQTLVFLVFLFLLARTQYAGTDTLRLPVRVFLEVDPLHLLTTLLATRAVQGLLWLALITIALSFVLGRFFCGWVCPMGALIQLVQKLPIRRRASVVETNRWRRSQTIKFYLLGGLLVAALFGLQWSGIFDPLSLVIRSMGLIVLPGIELGLRSLFNAAYRHNPLGIAGVSEPVFAWLQGRALNFAQPHYLQTVLIGLVFLTILALAFVRHRFWCRVLCPLGALLGLIARVGLFRIRQADHCGGCARCTFVCQGAAEPEIADGWRPSECLVCGNCTAVCPGALSMGFGAPRLRLPRRKATPVPAAAFAGTGIRRRHFLLASASGLAAVPLLRLGMPPGRFSPALIRPPGARAETEFLELCVRCGECMKVCLTNGLQPTLLEAGLEGMWTPRLVPRIGYCEYNCTLCGQVCPTQAIRRLPLEEKRKVRIGLATIDTARCLPYAFQTTCIVCEEHCPLPRKAIWFEEKQVVTRSGELRTVKQPHVAIDLCTGCGICETKCVVQDQPAIRVTSANEDRNRENRVLLEGAGGTA
jgi:polyferredoxin/ferredoxin